MIFVKVNLGSGDKEGELGKHKLTPRKPALLLHDHSHDIKHASEIAIVDFRRVYEEILRGVELRYGRQ